MNNSATFRQLVQSAEEDIIGGHLNAALTLIGHLLDSNGQWLPPHEQLPERTALLEQTDELKADYQRMLHYLAEGVADPSRKALYTRLKQRVFRLLQDVRRGYDKADGQTIYATIAKGVEKDYGGRPLGSDMVSFLPGEEQDRLFDIIWTSPQLHSHEERQLRLFLITAEPKLRCHLLSALTLALLHYFDAAKLRLLCSHSTAENESERARAVIGICLATQVHAKVITLYPTLREDIILLARHTQFAEDAIKAQHYISLYRDSEHLQQRMEQEILPALIKVSQQRKRMGFDEMEIDLTDPESTPKLNRKTRKMLTYGMQEMARLFMEGMDVNLPTFTSLKRFPFFKQPSHWLAPFDSQRLEVPSLDFLQHLPLCDSDKYSVSLLLNHIPEAQRNQLAALLDEHAEVMTVHADETRNEFQNVIQCLYRLTRRSPWAALWPDVFTPGIQLLDNALIGNELRKSVHFLQVTASSLLRHKHYQAAQVHLESLAKLQGSDVALLSQLALCAQEQGRYQQAINYCQQAMMLSEANSEVLYRQQYCYAQLGRYEDQLRCLQKLEAQASDNPRLLTETGLCLMQLKRWEEAQQRFYKLEVMGERLLPSMRAIAWCALQQYDLPQALKYYQRIVEGEMATIATWEDHLNLGHTLWLQGDIKAALPHYLHYVHGYASAQPEATDLLQPFRQDAPLLQEYGISETDICLVHDWIEGNLSPHPPFGGKETSEQTL